MNIWAISLKTTCQHNTYCVNSKDKIEPYIKKCMKEIKKNYRGDNNRYKIEWLAVDFAVIYEIDKDREHVWTDSRSHLSKFGEINRYNVH